MKSFGVFLLLVATALATPLIPQRNKIFEQFSHPILDIETRMIDGNVAGPITAPYIVSISISSLIYSHYCAGIIINKDWVLTGAHCITELRDLNGGDVVGLPIYAGVQDRSQIDNAQIRYIDFGFAHKGFNNKEGSDDIGLLHISEPFAISSRVRIISLPSPKEKFNGKEGTVYGWGLNNNDAVAFEEVLRVNRATILDSSECARNLPDNAPVSQQEICAEVSACYGDGGSPLVVEDQDGIAELAGIASWGIHPCGYARRPTMFTAASEYISWIAEVQWAYHILH